MKNKKYKTATIVKVCLLGTLINAVLIYPFYYFFDLSEKSLLISVPVGVATFLLLYKYIGSKENTK